MNGTVIVPLVCELLFFVATASGCASRETDAETPSAGSSTSISAQSAPTSKPEATEALITLGPASADLRRMDWTAATLPGQFCGIPSLVTLKDGEATAMSTDFGEVHVTVEGEATFGDIDGDGDEEAALEIQCDNGGGTAGGQLGFAYVVVRAESGALVSLGTITPQHQLADASHVTLLGGVTIEFNRAVVRERWYTPDDASCCPSGVAETIWSFDGSQLRANPPLILS